ncbi:metallophosphoesterase [Deinococcus yunweiensis]|uniref:metallophosphoesterase n=1 Tax=Deinococcus yunweiensis TaxID=367282 RepID=UPI00398F70CD
MTAHAAPGYDIVGDVHGCLDELLTLLDRLGYGWDGAVLTPPAGRQVVFVGDLVDRGPEVVGVVRLVMGGVQSGAALSVRGNHDERLARALAGEAVKGSASLDVSLAQLARVSARRRDDLRRFLAALPARLELDGGRLLVVHAGEQAGDPATREHFNVWGSGSKRVGQDGVKERVAWVGGYTGSALVAYGHTPVLAPEWHGHTVNLDTGAVFGGHLTALRYPERQTVSVPARRAYASTAHWRALTGVPA